MMKKIRNQRINNYLYSRGIYPRYEDDYGAVYKNSKKLIQALEDYWIRTTGFKNELGR